MNGTVGASSTANIGSSRLKKAHSVKRDKDKARKKKKNAKKAHKC